MGVFLKGCHFDGILNNYINSTFVLLCMSIVVVKKEVFQDIANKYYMDIIKIEIKLSRIVLCEKGKVNTNKGNEY